MENVISMENGVLTETSKPKTKKSIKRLCASIAAIGSALSLTSLTAFAGNTSEWDEVDVTGTDASATDMMGKIIGILLTITRFVGVALVVYGVYEVVMSFMQNQPEAKTKGIVMALAGVVMITLKSILESLGVIGGGGGEAAPAA